MIVAALAGVCALPVASVALAISPWTTDGGRQPDPVVSAIHTSGHCKREAQLI
jgi:hypothetical protein